MRVGNVIFSAPMILALLAGRKTMTRRLAWREQPKPQPHYVDRQSTRLRVLADVRPTPWQRMHERFQAAGPGYRELLYVKEAHCFGSYNAKNAKRRHRAGHAIAYSTERPQLKQYEQFRWRPSIHMPRWASRITLEVTATKMERLQDISEADAEAEGTQEPTLRELGHGLEQAAWTERKVFSRLWDSLHGKGAWDENPEIVVPTFVFHLQNVDALLAEREAA